MDKELYLELNFNNPIRCRQWYAGPQPTLGNRGIQCIQLEFASLALYHL